MITHYLQNSVQSLFSSFIVVNSDFILYKRIIKNVSLVRLFSFAESFTMKLIFVYVMLVFAIDRAYGDCCDGKILK